MRILVLADPRPGHLRQARGLAGIIAGERSCEIREIDVVPRPFAFERVRGGLSWLYGRLPGLPADRLLARAFGIGPEQVSAPDLVIGSGRPSILAGSLIARMTGAKFIYCGRAAGYDTRDIDLLLVPYAADGQHRRHAHAPIPSPVDPGQWAPPRRLATFDDLAGADVTLLIGGPSSHRRWAMPEWLQLGYFLMASESELHVRWSVATSRRTPAHARDLLASAFASLPQAGRFIDYGSEGSGSADVLLGADAVCVTSDSTSMIAEGLAAMRPVLAIGSHRLKRSRDDALLSDLSREGSFAEVPLAGLTAATFAAKLLQLAPPADDPRARIIAAVRPVIDSIG